MQHDSAGTDFDRALREAHARCGAPLCVGIDPVLEQLPEGLTGEPGAAFEAFSRGVVDAIAPHAAAAKFQSACYERLGAAGITALESGIRAAREAGLAVVLDAKRGDIGISARHYAAAAANLGAQAITVNAYLGTETIEPYLDAGLAIFVLIRTSNPGSVDVQDVPLRNGGTLAMHLGQLVANLGRSRPGVHAVVGATQHDQSAVLRAVMPDQLFLLPGLGAQGATVTDLCAFAKHPSHTNEDPTRGLLPTASRSVIYAGGKTAAWTDGVSAAAADLNSELRDAMTARATSIH
ncbi:MAG: orotidine-5'-phosphate decarboxylase [Phycisphaera sp.]|nr:MAG: orotidine-5'-phosphate decarboxylase [Phycisphaera sp.]